MFEDTIWQPSPRDESNGQREIYVCLGQRVSGDGGQGTGDVSSPAWWSRPDRRHQHSARQEDRGNARVTCGINKADKDGDGLNIRTSKRVSPSRPYRVGDDVERRISAAVYQPVDVVTRK